MKIGYKEMVVRGIAAFDALGNRIARVRSVEEAHGGISVCVIHSTHVKNLPVVGRGVSGKDDEAVEFCAFVMGGYIGARPEQ